MAQKREHQQSKTDRARPARPHRQLAGHRRTTGRRSLRKVKTLVAALADYEAELD